jgi:hypothetical protein
MVIEARNPYIRPMPFFILAIVLISGALTFGTVEIKRRRRRPSKATASEARDGEKPSA